MGVLRRYGNGLRITPDGSTLEIDPAVTLTTAAIDPSGAADGQPLVYSHTDGKFVPGASGAALFSKNAALPGCTVGAGSHFGVTVYFPPEGRSFLPLRWSLPPMVGALQPMIRFDLRLPNGSTTQVERVNSTGAPLTESADTVDFGADGAVCTGIEIGAVNATGAQDTQNLGTFDISGFQV